MKVYLEAYGCAQNLGEAEALRAQARAHGHQVLPAPQGADVGVLVTCAVIGSTEDRMVQRWRTLARSVPDLVVTGCMVPLRQARLSAPEGGARTHFLAIRAQEHFPGLLDRIAGDRALAIGAPPALLRPRGPGEGGPDGESPAAPVHREVVLAQGCTSHCSYCFSRLARGPLRSTPLPALRSRVEEAIRDGVVEVRLSSLDSSCWGADGAPGGPRLPELLRALGDLPAAREYRLRVGMMSPQSLDPLRARYFQAMAETPRVFRFLHLPVQSGADHVLRDMRRGYTSAQFLRCVRAARRRLPDLLVATDVIVGFPTEDAGDHASTLRLLEEVRPEVVNVTRFSPRPLTPAARLPPLLSREVKRRSRELTEVRMRIARSRMERWIGREGPAVVVEPGPGGTCVARMGNYLPVVLTERRPLGSWHEVAIRGARSTYLLGEVRGPAPGDGAVDPVPCLH